MPGSSDSTPPQPAERDKISTRMMRALPVPEPTREKLMLADKKVREIWKIFRGNWLGMTGITMLVFFIIMAVFAAQIMQIVAALAGWHFAYTPFLNPGDGVMLSPSSQHWMGTDQRGWDIFARTIYGSRISLEIGFFATLVSMVFGTVIGLMSGYWGGWRDEVLMRITDVFLVLPWLVFMIILATLLPGGPSIMKVIFVIGITGWSSTARIVRAQVLSIKERAFIERAKAIGGEDWHIVWRHIFPNVFPLVFADSILTVALSILSESTLSFIALGPPPNKVVTWGIILYDAYSRNAITNGLYLWIVIPGLCIVFVVLAFTFVGYALDEIFNPKLRKR
ncbi:MAG: ABC transporter permease [Thermoplasmata archaeon]|jgi:peptide/nickel transport system permease protein